MSGTIFISGARLIDPASGRDVEGDLRVENGVIVEIAPDLSPHANDQIIEADGAVLSPALIDIGARAAEPGGAGIENLDTTLRAAAAAGVGTLVLSSSSGTGLTRPEDIDWISLRALQAPIRLLGAARTHTHAGEMAEIGLMLRAGAPMISDGGALIADTRFLRNLLSYASAFDAWVGLTPEEAALSAGTIAHESAMAIRLGLAARPGISERLGVERLAALAELTGARVMIERLTTAGGLEALGVTRKRGLELAASAPLTHLLFNEVDMGALDPAYRLDPPLRSESDRQAMLAGIADGRIDLIVSDHTPVALEAKANPYSDAAPGSASLEALIPVLCTLDADGQLPLLAGLKALTSNPAELLGLPQGRLEEGAPADLVLFDPQAPNVYGKDGLESPAPSAFAGRRLQGRVLMSVVDGAIVFARPGFAE